MRKVGLALVGSVVLVLIGILTEAVGDSIPSQIKSSWVAWPLLITAVVLGCILTYVEVRERNSNEPPSRPVWNVRAPNPHFIGREELLRDLRRSLRKSAASIVHSLRGMGGVGKTSLAIEYTHRFARKYRIVWWINAEHPGLIPGQFVKLAAALRLPVGQDPEDAIDAVRATLRSATRWLLIFDNAERPRDIQLYLPGGSGHVLITTRRGGFGALGETLDIDVLHRAESINLLRRRIPMITDSEADTMADVLGDLPLALEQAAGYLDQNHIPMPDYLRLLQEHLDEMIDKGSVAGHEHTLASVWKLSTDRLHAENPAAVQILGICSYLAPEPIPLDLFTANADELPAPLAEVTADPTRWEHSVGALANYALVRRTTDGTNSITVHRLIQATTRREHATTDTDHINELRATIRRLLVASLPVEIEATPENWPRWQTLLPHVLSVIDGDDDLEPDLTAWLANRAGAYLGTQGQAVEAETLFRRAASINEANNGQGHPTVASDLCDLASCLCDLGRPAEALPIFQRALTIAETTCGLDHPDVAEVLSRLSRCLCDLRRPFEALPLSQRAVTIAEAAHDPNDSAVAIALEHLAACLRDLGRSANALPLYQRVLTIREGSYRRDHPEVARCLNNLAGCLCHLHQYRDALPLLQRALAIMQATHHANHPDVMVVRDNIDELKRKLAHDRIGLRRSR